MPSRAFLPLVLGKAEHVIRRYSPDTDLLEEVIQRLVMTVRRVTPPEMVGAMVLPLLARLENEAHVEALRHFFAMP